MIINIPLLKQKGNLTSGPNALRMISHNLGNNISEIEVEKLIDYKEGKDNPVINLALAAKKLGFEVELNTVNPQSKKENETESKKTGIKLNSKNLDRKEILSLVNKRITPLVLLNWNIVSRNPQAGFNEQYVVLCGYDSKFAYVNNSGGKKGMKLQAIPLDIFNKARTSSGMKEATIIITSKN